MILIRNGYWLYNIWWESISDEIWRVSSSTLVHYVNVWVVEVICHWLESNLFYLVSEMRIFDSSTMSRTLLTLANVDFTQKHGIHICFVSLQSKHCFGLNFLSIPVVIRILWPFSEVNSSSKQVGITWIVDVETFFFIFVYLFRVGASCSMEQFHLFNCCSIVLTLQKESFLIILFVNDFILDSDQTSDFTNFE